LGWTEGRNVHIDTRWGTDADSTRKYAAELVALAPDVILATASTATGALHQMTRTVPIVFVIVIDPVGAGYVESLARPGGNLTGFSLFEYGLSGMITILRWDRRRFSRDRDCKVASLGRRLPRHRL